MNRLKHLFRSRREHQESGNTLVVFVMLFPVMFTIFGLAVDISIANYVKESVQNSINTATQITLSQASNPINSDRPMLTNNQAYDIVKRLYAQNTNRGVDATGASGTTLPFLLCQTSPQPGGVLTTAPTVSTCAWTELNNGFQFSNANRTLSIQYSAVEVSRTAFLQFINLGTLKYEITGKASTSFSGSQS